MDGSKYSPAHSRHATRQRPRRNGSIARDTRALRSSRRRTNLNNRIVRSVPTFVIGIDWQLVRTSARFSCSCNDFRRSSAWRRWNAPCASRGTHMAFRNFGTDLAIDLGTANTCVYAKGRGVILNEPSLIAFHAASGVVEAVGATAREMLGRSPGHLRPVRPIKDGVIADFDATEKMLAHFIRKTH